MESEWELGDEGKILSDEGEFVVLQFRGLKCAGKRETDHGEAKLLSNLRHPNIVQFIGRFSPKASPSKYLVTELLDKLSSHLDNLPDPYSYSILRDVATGLCYLHERTPGVIHGDLNPDNILLTNGMHAKISNFGIAATVSPPKATQFKCSGAKEYMPPATTVYFTDIDIFSFGVMIIHIFSGESPKNLSYQDESERQVLLLQKIERDHPLKSLAKTCLNIDREGRPTALQVLNDISEVCEQKKTEEYLKNTFENHQKLQSYIDKKDREFNTLEANHKELIHEQRNTAATITLRTAFMNVCDKEIAELENEKRFLVSKGEQLQEEIKRLMGEKQHTETEISVKDNIIRGKDRVIGEFKDIIASISTNFKHHPLSMKQRISWIKMPDLPFGITAPQCVVIGTTLFVGGGQTDQNINSKHAVLHYSLDSNEWKYLTPSPNIFFGLGIYKGKLISVGGSDGESVTGKVLHYDKNKWCKAGPCMPTPRKRLCVASFQSGVIACGGIDKMDNAVDTVEVLVEDQWNTIASLPQPRIALNVTILDNIAYFSGGYYPELKRWEHGMMDCYSIDFSSILSGSPSWGCISPVPSRCSAIIRYSGTLLALGGKNESGAITGEVHAYNAATDQWLLINQMGFDRSSMAVATITENDIIVVGGWDPPIEGKDIRSKCTMRAYNYPVGEYIII